MIEDDFNSRGTLNTRSIAGSMIPLSTVVPARSLFSKSELTDNILGKTLRHITASKLSHAVLDKHKVVGWDLDETLINGKQSWFWRRWIRDNHKDKTFWIITFRNKIDHTIWDQLENCSDPVDRIWFQGIVYIPFVLWNTWSNFSPVLRKIVTEQEITPNIRKIAQGKNLELDYVIQVNRAIRAWKASECKKHDCTVLVEDREEFCKPYCDMLGIDFVNALKD